MMILNTETIPKKYLTTYVNGLKANGSRLKDVDASPWTSAGLVCAIAVPRRSGNGPPKLAKEATRCEANSTDTPAEARRPAAMKKLNRAKSM